MKEKVTNKQIDHREKGQSLVELALTITLILTLLAGIVDLGGAFFSYVALRDAAQEGALYGSIEPIIDSNSNGRYDAGEPLNTSEIVTRVRQSSSTPVNLNDLANVTVNITPSSLSERSYFLANSRHMLVVSRRNACICGGKCT